VAISAKGIITGLSSWEVHMLLDIRCGLSQGRTGDRLSGRSSQKTELSKTSSKRRKLSASSIHLHSHLSHCGSVGQDQRAWRIRMNPTNTRALKSTMVNEKYVHCGLCNEVCPQSYDRAERYKAGWEDWDEAYAWNLLPVSIDTCLSTQGNSKR
jgi:ferredoxin